MLSNFILVTGQVVTLFLLMAVGFVLAKTEKLTVDGGRQMSFICLYMVTPCIIIDTMQTGLDSGMARSVLTEIGLLAAIFAFFILLSRPMFPSRDKLTRPVLQFGMIFANVAFMGFPLIQSVLGQRAMIFATFFVIVSTAGTWIYGVYIMGGKMSILKALFNPATLGLYCGLPLLLTGWRLPAVIDNAVGFIAGLNTPLAMIVIGGQMARTDLKEILGRARLFEASAVRLVLMPAVVMAALIPLKLDPELYVTLVVLSATPCAGATSMFAENYRCNTSAAAQLVTLSTLLSIINLPVFATLAKRIAGI